MHPFATADIISLLTNAAEFATAALALATAIVTARSRRQVPSGKKRRKHPRREACDEISAGARRRHPDQ